MYMYRQIWKKNQNDLRIKSQQICKGTFTIKTFEPRTNMLIEENSCHFLLHYQKYTGG